MYKKTAKNIFLFLIRFSPVLFIVGPLFFTKGYLFFTDLVWGPNIPLHWSGQLFLLNAAVKGLSFVLPVALIEKLYITLCLGLVLWGGRKIAGLLLKEQSLIFVASLFALFNPFVYDRAMYGQIGIAAAFGLMLLGAGFLLEYLEKKRMRQVVYAAIAFAFAIQCAAHFLFFIAAFYLFVFLPGFLIEKWKISDGAAKEKILEAVKISAILAVIAFALNINWIIGGVTGTSVLGRFISTGITRQDLIAFQTAGKTGGDALVNVLMLSGFWGSGQFLPTSIAVFVNNLGGWILLFLSPLILWGFVAGLRSKEKKYRYMTIGSGVLFFVSIVLAAGIRIPVGRTLTYFLFDHLPFYKGLRESQKWVSITAAVYLIFLSIGLRELFAAKAIQRSAFMMKFFIGTLIVMQAPLLLFGFAGQVRSVEYPSDWYAVNNYLVHNSGCSGNTFFFPWHQYMSFPWISGIVANPVPLFFQCSVASGNNVVSGRELNNGATGEQNRAYLIIAEDVGWESFVGINPGLEARLVMETATLKVYEIIR